MLTNILHWLVKHPAVYDAVQLSVGMPVVERELKQEIARLGLAGVALDVGGGTGGWKALLPDHVKHLCLDLDPLKLRGFRAKFPAGNALLADARALPLADASVEIVMLIFVAHHLDDDALARALDESARVLKPGGTLIFADPLFVPERWPGRLLWRYDRGRHPRTLAAHRSAVARRFTLAVERRFAVVHAYALLIGRKPAAAPA